MNLDIFENLIDKVKENEFIQNFTKELENDLLNVLNLLCKYGADISYVSPNTKRTVRDFYLGGSLSKLLSQI